MASKTHIHGAFAILLTLTGCTSSEIGPLNFQQNQPEVAESGRVYSLISAAEGTSTLRQAASSLKYTAGEDINLENLGMVMVKFDLPDEVTGLEAITALESAVPTSTVGVNHAYRLQTGKQTSDRRNYAAAMINWPTNGCPALASVGIIDGGVNASAPTLSKVKIVSRNFGTGSPKSLRHGTEVASILADPSRLRGLNLYSANVISPNSDGEDIAGAAAIVQAIDWMGSQGAKIVNVSLAGPKNKLLSLAVNKAAEQDVLLVAAAGNLGRSASPQYPAAFPSVVAVTAVDANKRVYNKAVRGNHIDIAAPGVDVFVASESGGRYVSGTSVAVPFVTARLAAQSNRSLSTIKETAIDLGAQGKDETYGHGLLQASGICATN